MLKAKQSQMNQQLEVLDQQIKEAQQANQSQDEIPNFDKLKGRLILMITRFSVYLRKATPEAKNQLMKMLIDSIEITTDKQVKLVRYKIDESLIPQSLKKIGVFLCPNSNLKYMVKMIISSTNYHFYHLVISDKSERNEIKIKYILSK